MLSPRAPGSELRQPLGYTMVGGLIVSQALTLFTTPVIYLYLDQVSHWISGSKKTRPSKSEREREERAWEPAQAAEYKGEAGSAGARLSSAPNENGKFRSLALAQSARLPGTVTKIRSSGRSDPESRAIQTASACAAAEAQGA